MAVNKISVNNNNAIVIDNKLITNSENLITNGSVEIELKSLKYKIFNDFTPILFEGYYLNSSGNLHYDQNFNCKILKIRVIPGEKYLYLRGKNNDVAPEVIWFDENDVLLSIQYGLKELTVPEDTYYALFHSFENVPNEVQFEVIYEDCISVNLNNNLENEIINKSIYNQCFNFNIDNLIDGYFDYTNGEYGHYSDGGKYKCYPDFIPVKPGMLLYHNCIFAANAGIVFYDNSKIYITGTNDYNGILKVPDNCFFVKISDYNNTTIHNSNLFLRSVSVETYDTKNGRYWRYNSETNKVNEYGSYVLLSLILPIKVFYRDVYVVKSKSNGEADTWFLVDSNYNLIDRSNTISERTDTLTIENDGYLLVNSYTSYLSSLIIHKKSFSDNYLIDVSNSELEEYKNWMGGYPSIIDLNFVDGYIDYTTGIPGGWHDEHRYAYDPDYIEVFNNFEYYYNGSFNALGGVAYYDSEKVYIGGSNVNTGKLIIPDNTSYLRITDYNPSATHNAYITKVSEGKLTELENKLVSVGRTIICIGDSVTEGMATTGAHYARYGESPYPARLKTLLVDNGYDDITVENYGHGGERLQDVAVRLGAWPTVLTEDITLPADGSQVSLGTYSLDSYGRVQGTKLKLLHEDQNGDDYLVYLTQTSHDTNPITINGNSIYMAIRDNANFLYQEPSDSPLILKSGSVLFTANNRNATVCIIYIGINGSGSLNLEKWIEVNKRCGEMNGGKYIILGSTHSLFNSWSDVIGDNVSEKHAYYSRKCTDAFGLHFIDLYQDFFDRGVEILSNADLLSRFSEEQLTDINTYMPQRIVPAELSYNGQNRGDVHLSMEGYHIIGQLLFERLKELNYI